VSGCRRTSPWSRPRGSSLSPMTQATEPARRVNARARQPHGVKTWRGTMNSVHQSFPSAVGAVLKHVGDADGILVDVKTDQKRGRVLHG